MALLSANLVERVAESLTRYSMLALGTRLGVAVSGGADSVSLLHILRRLAPRFEITLAVLHVNHQLRAADSDADEKFVRQLAVELECPCFAIRTQPSSLGNLEAECRDQRREFFQQTRIAQNLYRVALGHTRSDQAETVLFRLLRGAGTAGLSAMRPVADHLIRPLLAVSRDEVRSWASAQGIAWREDKTNVDPQFTRNRLRYETIPELSRLYNVNLETTFAGTAAVAQAEEDFWRPLVESSFGNLRIESRWGVALNSGELNDLPLALRRRVIRRALSELRGDLRGLDLHHVDGVVTISGSIHGHDRVMLPGADVLRSFGTLLFAAPGRLSEERQYRIPVVSGEELMLPHGAGLFSVDRVTNRLQICANFESEHHFLSLSAFHAGGVAHPLAVRNWRPGDELRRAGHRNPEKLKTLFQEHKIVLWERKHWPVLVAGEEIIWARQFGCADGFEAQPDASGPLLHLTYSEVITTSGFKRQV